MQRVQNEVRGYLTLVMLKFCSRPIMTKSVPHSERGAMVNLTWPPVPVVLPYWKLTIAHDICMGSSLV